MNGYQIVTDMTKSGFEQATFKRKPLAGLAESVSYPLNIQEKNRREKDKPRSNGFG